VALKLQNYVIVLQMSQANSDAAMAELRLRLEAHQRMLARWEAKVARQLEKIVGLQKGVSRTFSTESAPATPFPGMPGELPSTAWPQWMQRLILLMTCTTTPGWSQGFVLSFARLHADA